MLKVPLGKCFLSFLSSLLEVSPVLCSSGGEGICFAFNRSVSSQPLPYFGFFFSPKLKKICVYDVEAQAGLELKRLTASIS